MHLRDTSSDLNSVIRSMQEGSEECLHPIYPLAKHPRHPRTALKAQSAPLQTPEDFSPPSCHPQTFDMVLAALPALRLQKNILFSIQGLSPRVQCILILHVS